MDATRWMMSLGLLMITLPAMSAEPISQSALARRQINECMSKRMGADRTLSYNEAMRSCKATLQPKDSLAANVSAPIAAKPHE